MTCAELKRRFGVHLDGLKWVQDYMLQDGANHLDAAVEMITSLGLGVWLMTDFRKTFVMDTELEFGGLWRAGYFGPREEGGGFVLLNMDHLVQVMCEHVGIPPLNRPGDGVDLMNDLNLHPDEFEVIQLRCRN